MVSSTLVPRSYYKGTSLDLKADHVVSATERWLAAQENRQEILPSNVSSVKYSPSSEHQEISEGEYNAAARDVFATMKVSAPT